MDPFATVDDVTTLWRALTADEQEKVSSLLPTVSDSLRQKAKDVGKDLDQMISSGDLMENGVKSVVVDIIARYLDQLSSEHSSTVSQETQSALGYSWTGTYVNTGGGLSILDKDLKRLGLKRQRYGMVDLYGIAGD